MALRTMLLSLLALWVFPQRVIGEMDFVIPPPFGTTGDFSKNPVYEVGSSVTIVWTASSSANDTSLEVWQYNLTGEFISGTNWYLIHKGSPSVTSYNWIVGTEADLSVSPVFALSIFVEGNTAPDSNSHYFNITDSSISTSTSSTSTSTSTSTSSSTITSAAATTTAAVVVAESSSSGLSTGAQAGIGVGVGIAGLAVVGALAAYFMRRRSRAQAGGPVGHAETAYSGAGAGPGLGPGHYADPNALSPMTPHAQAPPTGMSYYQPHDPTKTYGYQPVHEADQTQAYEMPAQQGSVHELH